MISDVKFLHSWDIAEIGMHVIKARMQMKMKSLLTYKSIMTSASNYGRLGLFFWRQLRKLHIIWKHALQSIKGLTRWWRDTEPKPTKRQESGKVSPVFKDAFILRIFTKTVANPSCRNATSWGKGDTNWRPESTWSTYYLRIIHHDQVIQEM